MSIRTKRFVGSAAAITVSTLRLQSVVVELQPEPGRLDADVGVEAVPLEGVERGDVLCRDRRRLGRVHDLLAEHVDGRELPLCIQPGDDAQRVVERGAGDVARGEAAHDSLRHDRQRGDDDAVEQAHGAGA